MNPKLYFLLILLFKFQPSQAQNQPSFSQETLLGQSLPNLYSASIPLLPEVGKAFEEMQKEARKESDEDQELMYETKFLQANRKADEIKQSIQSNFNSLFS